MKQSKYAQALDRLKRVPLLGFILCMLSAGIFGLCNVIVKKVEVDPFTIAFYRFLGILLPSISIVIYRQEVGISKSIYKFKFQSKYISLQGSLSKEQETVIDRPLSVWSFQSVDHLLWTEAHAHGRCQHDIGRVTNLGRYLCQDIPEGASDGV